MGAVDRDVNILCHITGDIDQGTCTIVNHIDVVVLNAAFVSKRLGDVGQLIGLTEYGQCRAASVGHLACLCCRVLVGDVAHSDVQGLGRRGEK